MKINKKEYGMGGSTMEMYASGGMLKALLKDPKQREMAKAMINEFENGGKITPEEQAIRDEINNTKVVGVAMPTKEDLMEAYKMTFQSGQTGSQSLEDFLKMGVDAGDLRLLTDAAKSIATKRTREAAKSSKNPADAQKRQIESGTVIGSSYRPGSAEAEIEAGKNTNAAVDAEVKAMLEGLGLKV